MSGMDKLKAKLVQMELNPEQRQAIEVVVTEILLDSKIETWRSILGFMESEVHMPTWQFSTAIRLRQELHTVMGSMEIVLRDLGFEQSVIAEPKARQILEAGYMSARTLNNIVDEIAPRH